MKRVLIVGCGAIGSLYAAHLARVADVWALVRRDEHARILNDRGIQVTGKRNFVARIHATAEPRQLPDIDIAIVATKATHTRKAFAPVARICDRAAVVSAQNGLGSEELLVELTRGYVMRATTFMSGTRHSDCDVELELDQYTWLGPFEAAGTPFSLVKEVADLIVAGGLKAVALEDARPAQWSKLIFNASVNAVSALTQLPHSPEFADENSPESLGRLLHDLIDEGRRVAAGAGIELHEDPWAMNKIGAQTNHPTSMLFDVEHELPTEVDYLCGAIAREAQRASVSAPLHSAMWRLIKGLEASWQHERKRATQRT
ncbi:MAG TPA: ketopantoate reductase family protein [Terriglobales bacterium]|nr:ketopantoate reductase family protein [Terriglobales bacterium]